MQPREIQGQSFKVTVSVINVSVKTNGVNFTGVVVSYFAPSHLVEQRQSSRNRQPPVYTVQWRPRLKIVSVSLWNTQTRPKLRCIARPNLQLTICAQQNKNSDIQLRCYRLRTAIYTDLYYLLDCKKKYHCTVLDCRSRKF
jgi:hypothetical protein